VTDLVGLLVMLAVLGLLGLAVVYLGYFWRDR
jgi:hypothetical protein